MSLMEAAWPLALTIAILAGLITLVAWVPGKLEQRRLAKLEPADRVRAARYNNIMNWPRNHYNATLDSEDRIQELEARLAKLEAQAGKRWAP